MQSPGAMISDIRRREWEPHVCVCAGEGLVAQGIVGVGPQVLLLDHLRQQHYVHPAPACSTLSIFQMAAQQTCGDSCLREATGTVVSNPTL